MTKVVNSKNLERSSARWYDSEDPSNRTIAVHMHKGALSISTRNHPSEVWSPHKQMFLDASIDVPAADRVEAEVARLRDGLRQLLDCKGSYNGTVSEQGGDPAVCTKCEARARALLAEDGAA